MRTHTVAQAWLLLSFLTATLGPVAADPLPAPAGGAVVVLFEHDPLGSADAVLEGAALERLSWERDAPAFPGDRAGSLVARYDALRPAGRIGWPLPPGGWTQDDPFVAAAAFAIEPEGFSADPFGFFQISWGLWNARTTGMERTGSLQSFAGDTFDLIEFDYFPNVSPFFGGPFLSPTVFGSADESGPLFDVLGAFANVGFGSAQTELPLGEPLLARMEHRPGAGALIVTVHRITANGELLPVPGAVTVVPTRQLARPEFAVDTVGLTLWRDGFSGPTPSLRATVRFHALVARPGNPVSPAGALGALLAPAR